MKITTKTRYALRLVVDLAEREAEGYVALNDVAKRQDISKKYLEQIVPVLLQAGILKTSRGYHGGYRLAKDPAAITVADLMTIAEGPLAPVICLINTEKGVCSRSGTCPTQFVWRGLEKAIEDYLTSITIKDILDRQSSSKR